MPVAPIKALLLKGVEAAASVVLPIVNRVQFRQAVNIPLERQRRALSSTVDYVQRNMRLVKTGTSKFSVLVEAFQRADISGNRLICEFGVFSGSTINFLAKLTGKTVHGFDSFEGLPEAWPPELPKGYFALKRLPKVRKNVTLVKGWFHQTLPGFLEQNPGMMAFVHIDCDLYSSTKIVFELLEPRLVPGAVIVFDEYFNYPDWEEGEYKAFNEFLTRTGLSFDFICYNRKGHQVAVLLK
jgi:hypothetical protein